MKNNWLYVGARAVLRPFVCLLFRVHLTGKNNLPEKGRFIVCSNHVSMLDPFFLAISQRRQLHFMAKAELFHNRILASLIRAVGGFPVNRGKGDTEAMDTAADILRQEGVLGIFIEGTRSKTGELLRPKTGAVLLGAQTGAPLLPVSICCKGGSRPRLFRRVYVSCGEPVTVEELGVQEGGGMELRSASRELMERIRALREADLGRAAGRPAAVGRKSV